MPLDRHFTAGDTLLVRVSARQRATLPPVPDLEEQTEAASQRRKRLLLDVASDAGLMETLFLSSPPLVTELHKALADDPVDRRTVDRLAQSVSRYLVRMRSRATPFGLMAGVAPGRASETTRLTVGAGNSKTVRPDGEWLAAVIHEFERSPEQIPSVRVWMNPMCHQRGSRLVLPDLSHYYGPPQDRGQRLQEGSVRLTPLVAKVAGRCKQPVPIEQLVRDLRDAFPNIPEGGIWSALRTLLANGFLVSELWTAPRDADPLGRMLDLTGTATLPAINQVVAAAAALKNYAKAEIGRGAEELICADTVLRDAVPEDSVSRAASVIQVDLNLDIELHLARKVLCELERAATVLQRTSGPRSQRTRLVDYQQEFAERYGLFNPVPVLEAVDPTRGIGPPADYQRPPGHRQVRWPYPRSNSATAALAAAAQSALLSGAGEMDLNDELIEALDSEPEAPVWPSVDLTVQIHSASVESIDNDDYQLSLVPQGCASNAGRMFGRFLGGSIAADRLQNVLRQHAEWGPVPVQIDYRPPHARSFNVTHAPILGNQYLSVDGLPITSQPVNRHAAVGVDINDIAVYASVHGLHATNLNDGVEVYATPMHMLNPEAAPNVARLLEEIEALNSRPLTEWNWGALGVLPHLPRVRYGRTVLCPARWRPVGLTGGSATNGPGWAERLAHWQRRLQVPNRVVAVSLGRRLSLDLSRPGDRAILRAELIRSPETVLSEDLTATLGSADWLDGREHEITVPLFGLAEKRRAAQPRIRARAVGGRPPAREESAPVHFPGEDWVYLRFYLSEAGVDSFLVESLAELMGNILPRDSGRWFYVRYDVPECHIRLRIQSDRATPYPGILADVARWARRERQRGSLREFDLATYRPEAWRYGHGKAMHAAEAVFWRDSQSVLAQLSGRICGRLQISANELAAINYVQILRSLDVPEWLELVRSRIDRSRPAGVTREQRQRLSHLVDLSGPWTALATSAAGRALISSWEERAEAVSEYARLLKEEAAGESDVVAKAGLSLMHMHFNRLCGIDRTKERQSLSLLRELLHGHLARLERS